MGSFFVFLGFLSFLLVLASSISFTEFIYPNLTGSNFKFVDASGSFLFSRNGTYKAAIFNPGAQQIRFYLCVIHVESNTIIWSANRDAPISNSGIMSFTKNGIILSEEDGSLKWSTPSLQSSVTVLQLTEAGNFVLLGQYNKTLWESFANPTDTIVIGQKLILGRLLSSGVSGDDLSTGNFNLALTASDAILQWQAFTYWKLSMDPTAYTNSNYAVEYMAVNQTGLYLFGSNGSIVVVLGNLLPSNFRIAKVDSSGQFIISSSLGANKNLDFVSPVDQCRIPYICGSLGLCTNGFSLNNPVCSCPSSFHVSSNNTTKCVPVNNSYSLEVSCNSTDSSHMNSSTVSYMQLGNNMDYFAIDFTVPAKFGVNLSGCQDFCSSKCTCLGIFYENASGFCYALEHELGSLVLRTKSSSRLGFIKTLVLASPNFGSNDDVTEDSIGFPTAAVVLLPLSGILLLIVIAIFLWRRSKIPKLVEEKSNHSTSRFSGDLELSIPGLPLRFVYEELEGATENFKTQIGIGGFGSVYKGMLPDKSFVAVKMINNIGVRGKKDFCTEIAIIANIHHVNLVKLRGYCAQRRQWLLVYEYMNRGSLDKSLFGHEPVLEWQERVEIAVGAARGLAYLHSGCAQKIIHCDVKPENILLHDHFQAKISDFGLSKLLSPEQSSLFTTMRGTRGYLAPEWLTNSSITDKTDVYSFGMVLLEIVSGRKNCLPRTRSHSLDENHSAAGAHSLSSSLQELDYFPLYAMEMHEQGRYIELVDSRIHGRVTSEEVEKFVRVALCCVHEEPVLRPSMVIVVGMLEGNIPLSEPRIESLNFLRFYGRRLHEASVAVETGALDGDKSYQPPSAYHTSTNSVYNTCFSDISSQQISGPR